MTAGPSRRAALGRAGSAGASRAYPPLGRGVPLAPLWGEGGGLGAAVWWGDRRARVSQRLIEVKRGPGFRSCLARSGRGDGFVFTAIC